MGLALGLVLAAVGCRTAERQSVLSLNDGLVAHWTFDEGSGNVARDSTGNGHDAALQGVDWVPSPRGQALRFDSKEDAARYGNTASMDMEGDVTLALWVKVDPTVNPETCHLLFGDTGVAVERNFSLYLHGPGVLRFEWTDGKTVAPLLAPASLLNGTWKHVVVVANSTARHAAMYIDGERVAEMPMPVPITKTVFKERLTGWFYNGFFTGELDDVRLYSRALAVAEVKRLFAVEADVQIGTGRLVFDGTAAEPCGLAPLQLRNWSKQPRRVELSGAAAGPREILLEPGAQAEVSLGQVPLKPVWSRRTDLFIVADTGPANRLTMTVQRGAVADTQPVILGAELAVEPLRVVVDDPWQAKLAPGKTARVRVDVKLALPARQLGDGVLELRLRSRETGKECLARQIKAPAESLTLTLDVKSLPWGAYDLDASFRTQAGGVPTSTRRLVTILPGGVQQIRVLNNLVSELMDARPRGLLGQPRIEFMNPREGWVWFRAAGDCSVRLKSDELLAAKSGQAAVEAMRLLPAGKHVMQVSGTPADLVVRAIPALVYNVYPSGPQIAPFGSHTWERLKPYTLPNTNMIESQVVDTPEQREWQAQGRMWICNVQAPGLIDKTEWTVEKMLEVWLNPGKATAWNERSGFTLDKFSGVQVDEYYPGGAANQHGLTTALSIARAAEHPAYAGKLWIPFAVNMYGNPTDELLMKTSLGSGWPFSVEVYEAERATEKENLASLRGRFLGVASAWEQAYPGSMRRAIFTPMYAYLPYCTTNCYPQADFRVHLDLQMQLLANDPALFGLWGVQPYRSNYVDEEILNCMGMLLRHYAIEGKTARMLSDPYELRHVTDPDFAAGTARWQLAPAEEKGISAGTFVGYGELQGRYPVGTMGDTFLLMTRSAKAPNAISQQLQGLQAGRLYSLKVLTGDYGDLQAGKSRKDQQALTIALEGAEVQPGGFSYPFKSCRGPKPFTAKEPFWMTYHWLRFRAQGPTATLRLSDWAKPGEPGGPVGQQTMVNFVEVQPVFYPTAAR
jgi:hypothetical protein